MLINTHSLWINRLLRDDADLVERDCFADLARGLFGLNRDASSHSHCAVILGAAAALRKNRLLDALLPDHANGLAAYAHKAIGYLNV